MKTIDLMIAEGEGLTIEFKEKYSPKIIHDIVAFANAKGGTVLLGVSDSGDITGEKLTNSLKAQIVDLGRNCKPPIFVEVSKHDNSVIVIAVPESEEKPHLCGDGFFKRFDGLTQKLSPSEIRKIFQHGAQANYESHICEKATIQDLSLEKINTFLRESNTEIVVTTKSYAHLLENIGALKNGAITNVALLMFAKDIRKFLLHGQLFAVAYKGTEGVHIYDKKYIRDDLLTQYNEALLFCQKHLNERTEIKQGVRKDSYEIPLDVIREALANAIIHRDYSMTGTNVLVEIHEDRLVISNPGGLPDGYDLKMLGTKSVRRNEVISDLFSRMDKVERFGSGIKRIRQILSAAQCPEPIFESEMFFTVTLVRPLEHQSFKKVSRSNAIGKPTKQKRSDDRRTKTTEKNSKLILQAIKVDPKITQEALADKLMMTADGVRYHFKVLQEKKIIQRKGSKKTGHWIVLKDV